MRDSALPMAGSEAESGGKAGLSPLSTKNEDADKGQSPGPRVGGSLLWKSCVVGNTWTATQGEAMPGKEGGALRGEKNLPAGFIQLIARSAALPYSMQLAWKEIWTPGGY
jgi:hypothetical protein